MLLVREDSGFSRVERIWSGAAVCVATGPSVTDEQLGLIKASGRPTIAVNNAYKRAPWAALCYFADYKWWKWQQEKGPHREVWDVMPKCSCENARKAVIDPAVHFLRIDRGQGVVISQDPRAIVTGGNSGYQAVNIAALAGADPIILVGYDAKPTRGADGELRHHDFGEHPDKTFPPYGMINAHFVAMAQVARERGLRILNATPGSALECFERVDLAAVLQSDT